MLGTLLTATFFTARFQPSFWKVTLGAIHDLFNSAGFCNARRLKKPSLRSKLERNAIVCLFTIKLN